MTIRVGDRSNVAEVRRAAREHAERLGWREGDRGDCEIVATELATNLVKHARDGVVAVTSSAAGVHGAVRLVAVDRGPGMTDWSRCLVDGYSTAGSCGTGLGAVRRLSSDLEVVSTADGTVIVAELRRAAADAPRGVAAPGGSPAGGLRIAGFELAKEGQAVSGDGWTSRPIGASLAVLVCDGLGHGEAAHEASRRAIECFRETDWAEPKEVLAAIDVALRPTRGAAGAVALIDPAGSTVRFAGIGNVAASLIADDRTRHLVSLNGILGGRVHRITQFEYPWSEEATLVLHSDGISARWQASRWPGLWQRHPALIAAVLYRDCARGSDDVVAVVVRR